MAKKIENLLTLAEVSEFLRVKPSLVKYWVRMDKIPYIRLGRQVRFEEGEVREWLANRKENGQLSNFYLRKVI
jgi:excisionase family DNA binding protein